MSRCWWNQIVRCGCRRRMSACAIRASRSDSGCGPGLVDAAHRPPAPGEVAVQVDPVRVLARAGGDAVRVEVGDDPEIKIARCQIVRARRRSLSLPSRCRGCNRPPARCPRPVADLDRVDRPPLPGTAEQHRARRRKRRQRTRHDNGHNQSERPHASGHGAGSRCDRRAEAFRPSSQLVALRVRSPTRSAPTLPLWPGFQWIGRRLTSLRLIGRCVALPR